MGQVPKRRRGVCGECGGITTWFQKLVSGRWGRKLLAECMACGNRLVQ